MQVNIDNIIKIDRGCLLEQGHLLGLMHHSFLLEKTYVKRETKSEMAELLPLK